MRRYELMLVLRPDLPDDRSQAILDRATRSIAGSGGQLVKVSPWGRRRLAYPIGPYHEGSYHIVVFDSPPEGVLGLERDLALAEEVMRHLVTRVERPTATHRTTGPAEGETEADLSAPPEDDEFVPDGEFIDESESEAAPAAID
ncbi:MAG TPA: 30S ribosomal protein S6 [Candidatus Limnocylindrales bacterium]|jgi:small subunit ribosomal protein S6